MSGRGGQRRRSGEEMAGANAAATVFDSTQGVAMLFKCEPVQAPPTPQHPSLSPFPPSSPPSSPNSLPFSPLPTHPVPQTLVIAFFIFSMALVGMFYPYNRGAMLAACVVLYALTAGISGEWEASVWPSWGRDLLLAGPGPASSVCRCLPGAAGRPCPMPLPILSPPPILPHAPLIRSLIPTLPPPPLQATSAASTTRSWAAPTGSTTCCSPPCCSAARCSSPSRT